MFVVSYKKKTEPKVWKIKKNHFIGLNLLCAILIIVFSKQTEVFAVILAWFCMIMIVESYCYERKYYDPPLCRKRCRSSAEYYPSGVAGSQR